MTSAVTASPPGSPGSPTLTFDNPILGYRIAFPSGYRRSASRIIAGSEEDLGRDDYTPLSEVGARTLCLQDSGDVALDYPQRESEVGIRVSRNVHHLSVTEWVATPQSTGTQPLSAHQKVQQLTIAGLEAVRLVTDNVFAETTLFVISANDRMYVISPDFWRQPSSLPKGWLDEIASSFVATAPAPFPSASPTTPPVIATRAVADALAGAFTGRDADAIARLMPSCRITVFPAVDGVSGVGPLNRSTASFVNGLRARFAAGDLTVSVDPTERSLHIRPQFPHSIDIARAFKIFADQQHKKRCRVDAPVVPPKRHLAQDGHFIIAELMQHLAGLGVLLGFLSVGLMGSEVRQDAARDGWIEPQTL